MTKQEQKIVVDAATGKLQRHFDRPEVQKAIREVLTAPIPGEK